MEPGYIGPFMPVKPQEKKSVILRAGVIDPTYKEEIALLAHCGGEKE